MDAATDKGDTQTRRRARDLILLSQSTEKLAFPDGSLDIHIPRMALPARIGCLLGTSWTWFVMLSVPPFVRHWGPHCSAILLSWLALILR